MIFRSIRTSGTAIFLAGLALAALSRAALADEPVPRLAWHATPDCSSGSAVLGEISRVLQGAFGSHRDVAGTVNVTRRIDGVWRVALRVDTDGVSRDRSFEAESCDAAVSAVALILAIAINPRVSTAAAETTNVAAATPADAPSTEPPPPAPPPAPSPSLPVPAEDHDRTTPRPFSQRRFMVGASLIGDSGTLPKPAIGAELAFGVQTGRFHAEISGSYWGADTATSASTAASGHFRLLAGDLRVGYAWSFDRFTTGPLVDAGIESLDASGDGGSVRNLSASAVFAAVGAGWQLTWHVGGPIAVRLAVSALFPLSRPTFVVLEPTPSTTLSLHEPAAAFGRLLLGPELAF